MFEIIAYRGLTSSGGSDQVVLYQFDDVGGIEQGGFNEDAGSEPVVVLVRIHDVPVKCKAQDLQFHDRARRQGLCEDRRDPGF